MQLCLIKRSNRGVVPAYVTLTRNIFNTISKQSSRYKKSSASCPPPPLTPMPLPPPHQFDVMLWRRVWAFYTRRTMWPQQKGFPIRFTHHKQRTGFRWEVSPPEPMHWFQLEGLSNCLLHQNWYTGVNWNVCPTIFCTRTDALVSTGMLVQLSSTPEPMHWIQQECLPKVF